MGGSKLAFACATCVSMIWSKYLDFGTLAQEAISTITAKIEKNCIDFPSTNEVGFMVKLLYKLFVSAHHANSLLYNRFRLFYWRISERMNFRGISAFPGENTNLIILLLPVKSTCQLPDIILQHGYLWFGGVFCPNLQTS